MRASCPPSPRLTRTPPGFCTTISGLAGSSALEFVSIEVITGMVLEAGSRLEIEASRDRARVNAKVTKWPLEAVMGSKNAEGVGHQEHAPPCWRGSPRGRDAVRHQMRGLKLRPDEQDRIWQRDKDKLPRLC